MSCKNDGRLCNLYLPPNSDASCESGQICETSGVVLLVYFCTVKSEICWSDYADLIAVSSAVDSTIESRSRIELIIAFSGVMALCELDRRECRGALYNRGETRTDPVRPLTRWPLSTLSWIISSSMRDISSTDFRFLSTLRTGSPLLGASRAIGLNTGGLNVRVSRGDSGFPIDSRELGGLALPASLSWTRGAFMSFRSEDELSGVSSFRGALPLSLLLPAMVLDRTADLSALTVLWRSAMMASFSSSCLPTSSDSCGARLNPIEVREWLDRRA